MKNLRFTSFAFLALAIVFFSACDGTENPPIDNPTGPEVLTCGYFNEGTNRVLTDDPDEDVDYIITCQTYVNVDLTIEPGVVIEFQNDAGLEVGENGSISAVGSSDKPIVLTGVDKVAGSWSGVLVNSNDVKNELEHVTISYGGGSAFNSNGNQANLILWAQTRMRIDNCTFSNSATYGVEMAYQDYTIPSFANNSFKMNNIPMYIMATDGHVLSASNDFTENTNDYILTGCSGLNEGNFTWEKLNVPFRVEATDFGITRKISVGNNSNLIIAAGTRIDFGTDTELEVEDGGSLKAIGTTADPIVFSGVDGAAGAWRGLEFRFTQSVNNQLDNCIIEYAGSGSNDAAIYMWADPKLSVTNCIIRDVDGCVFTDATGSGGFNNPNFSESGNTFENITGAVECD